VRLPLCRTALTAGFSLLLLCGGAWAEDPEQLLQRIKTHMLEHRKQLPNYACHETIDRLVRSGDSLRFVDQLEVEVAFEGTRELFSRPGSSRFGDESIEQIAGSGTIGNTALGSNVDSIFSGSDAEFKFAGAGTKEGHKTYRFDVRVPLEKSHLSVRHDGAEGMTGYQSSIWVDVETLDLVRVDFHMNRIPDELGVRLIEQSLHYKILPIGNSRFALPERAELAATDSQGKYSLNLIKLGRCREFGADSVVRFGSAVQGDAARERRDH
jgi:hypothetical protein